MRFEQKSIMTFKCHKVEETTKNVLYPVHDIGFHPNNMASGFVSTVGGDGFMYFWDYKQKNKLKTFSFNKQPVTRAELCHEGKYMALALGYDWSRGVEMIGSVKPKIFIYEMQEKDLKH